MPKISRNEYLSPHYIIPPINHHVKHNSQLIHKYLAARAARSLLPSPLGASWGWLRPVGLRLLCVAWLVCLLVVPLRGSRFVCLISCYALCCRIAPSSGYPSVPSVMSLSRAAWIRQPAASCGRLGLAATSSSSAIWFLRAFAIWCCRAVSTIRRSTRQCARMLAL